MPSPREARLQTQVWQAEAYVEREASRAAAGHLRVDCPCGEHNNELDHAMNERQKARMALSRLRARGG